MPGEIPRFFSGCPVCAVFIIHRSYSLSYNIFADSFTPKFLTGQPLASGAERVTVVCPEPSKSCIIYQPLFLEAGYHGINAGDRKSPFVKTFTDFRFAAGAVTEEKGGGIITAAIAVFGRNIR